MAVAELLARVIAAIRIANIRWGGLFSLNNTEIGSHGPWICGAAIQIVRLAFIGVTCVRRGILEWLAGLDYVR